MGVKTYGENNVKSKYNFQRKAGRSLIERKPVFSPDGESVLVIVENVVRVYNIQTGDCARVLETESPVKELVAIQFPDDENYNLYGCSDTGCVTTWTWENGAVLRETNFEIPHNMKVLTFDLLENNECFITAARAESKCIALYLYSIKTGDLIHEYNEFKAMYNEGMVSVAVGHCNGDRFAALANGTPKLFVQNLNQPHVTQIIVNSNQIRILSVATHSAENALAITDALGRTTIYRGNFYGTQNGNNIAKECLHWHYLPAMAVCFSMQGSYLYTGGMEQVLVKWTVGRLANKASERMFIPRLPGIVKHITTCNSYIAVALSNNSIVIANAQMRVVSTILECGGLSPVARALGFPLVYHQRLGGLLLGGRTGHLQLYSTATDKVLFNIDITGLNNIPPLRNNLLPLNTEVTCAAISGNGTWLVTSEYRNDGVTYPEERLKFWNLQIKNTKPFILNTCVNLSHGGCRVVSIALSNRAEFCVTAGADQKFRIWKKENTSQPHRKKESWCCLTACYYSSGIAQSLAHGILNNYKNGEIPPNDKEYPYVHEYQEKNDIIKKIMNIHKEQSILDEAVVDAGFKSNENDMSGVAISQDGSLIAAWFGSKLTLWDTHLCNLRTTLSHPVLRPKGVHVKFGNKDAAHYLVCTTENYVAVWSLLSLTVKWLVPISATCLAADPLSNRMAIVTTNNDVFVFTPHSSTPLLTHKRLLRPDTGVFKQCAFGDCSEDNIRLYVVRNDSEIFCLEPEQSDESRLEVISRRNLPASGFSALLAQQRAAGVRAARGDVTHTPRTPHSAIAQFLSAAPHMIPPVSLLCTSFLRHIAGHEDPAPADPADAMQVDQSSSEDEDDTRQANGPYAPKPTPLWTPNYEKVKEKRLQRIVKEPLLDLHETTDIFGV